MFDKQPSDDSRPHTSSTTVTERVEILTGRKVIEVQRANNRIGECVRIIEWQGDRTGRSSMVIIPFEAFSEVLAALNRLS